MLNLHYTMQPSATALHKDSSCGIEEYHASRYKSTIEKAKPIPMSFMYLKIWWCNKTITSELRIYFEVHIIYEIKQTPKEKYLSH